MRLHDNTHLYHSQSKKELRGLKKIKERLKITAPLLLHFSPSLLPPPPKFSLSDPPFIRFPFPTCPLSLFLQQYLPSVRRSCPGRQPDHLVLTSDQASAMMPSRQQGLLNVTWWQAAHWTPGLEQNGPVSAALDACFYKLQKRFTDGSKCSVSFIVT